MGCLLYFHNISPILHQLESQDKIVYYIPKMLDFIIGFIFIPIFGITFLEVD